MINEKDQKKPIVEEEQEIEVSEFSLTESEIDSFVKELEKLKKTKTNFTFPIDENNEFIVHYAGLTEYKKKKDIEDSDEKFYESDDEEGE